MPEDKEVLLQHYRQSRVDLLAAEWIKTWREEKNA